MLLLNHYYSFLPIWFLRFYFIFSLYRMTEYIINVMLLLNEYIVGRESTRFARADDANAAQALYALRCAVRDREGARPRHRPRSSLRVPRYGGRDRTICRSLLPPTVERAATSIDVFRRGQATEAVANGTDDPT